jgi:hypothetical protein
MGMVIYTYWYASAPSGGSYHAARYYASRYYASRYYA